MLEQAIADIADLPGSPKTTSQIARGSMSSEVPGRPPLEEDTVLCDEVWLALRDENVIQIIEGFAISVKNLNGGEEDSAHED